MSVPYSLPAVGQAVAIGTNTADAVRPAGASSFDWAYANFNGYGGGVFAKDYSSAGAYVISSCGSHGAPGNNDALIFDFADATWKRLANTAPSSPQSPNHFIPNGDISPSAISNDSWWEISSVGHNVPGASHTYNTALYLSRALGGGTKGSFLKMGNWASTTSGGKNGSIHRLDLETGAWLRVVQGLPTDDYENVAVMDEVAGRAYFIQHLMHRRNNLNFLRLSDLVLDTTPGFGSVTDQSAGGEYHCDFIDPVNRLLIQHQSNYPLRALQLNNIAAGWKYLNESGSRPGSANRVIYYPTTGKFYTRGNDDGNVLKRLTPPSGNALSGTWSWDTVTVAGAAMPNFTNTGSNDGRRHYSTFFHVPALDCLAWVSGESTQVILLRPPG